MPRGPVRRAQLIAPFGVGSMIVVRDGASLISCGLDHFFENESGNTSSELIDRTEFMIEEWRLQRLLRVNHFRTPPDYRRVLGHGERIPNAWLTIPFLRFPKWHFCPLCNRISEWPLSLKEKPRCNDCKSKRRPVLLQVPFIAICESGHIQDFPWREWVHGTPNPTCEKPMKLKSTGGASLASREIVCECEKKRNLGSITTANSDGTTYLSNNLDSNKTIYSCRGLKPWLGLDQRETCDRPLRGSLRSASNVYFADVRSAIYLPRGQNSSDPELVRIMSEPPLCVFIDIIKDIDAKKMDESVKIGRIRDLHRPLVHGYTDDDIKAAYKVVIGSGDEILSTTNPSDDEQTAFRRSEFNILRNNWRDSQLDIRKCNLKDYPGFGESQKAFSNISLVNKLRETRVLSGFSRIFPESNQNLDARKNLLWRNRPQNPQEEWLPAYVVFGEGIFIEFNEQLLASWENRGSVKKRVKKLSDGYQKVQRERQLRERDINPRFVLIHTLSHLLMNQLIFECGYSSAALRERLYISKFPASPMAGMLIYTAAGDAEGSLGGLVRMGKPGYLEPVIKRAVTAAKWCSADPVCMEIGEEAGQGPDSCNLAACHNCGLVPETACEEFNRFLDRALIIGDRKNPDVGFFSKFDIES